MNRRAFFLVFALLLTAGCSNSGASTSEPAGDGLDGNDQLLVFAAASLTDAFQTLGAAFQVNHPNVESLFNFGGSQQLAQQIVGGAPADVFASADQAQMQVAVGSDRVTSDAVLPFAANRLVVVFPQENPAQIEILQDLATPGVRLVLAAEQVPAGQYTLRFLENATAELGPNYRRKALENVVSYELNVRAVLTKVTLGEADAGIVYSSDLSELSDAEVGQLEIPEHLNVLAHYYIAPLADAQNAATARAFVDFVLSSAGQEILQRYGLLLVSESVGK